MADSIEQVVYTYLTSDSTFMSLITGGVYWIDTDKITPTAGKPYVVFWLVDDNGSEQKLNTFSQGEARIQFDLWDTNKIRGARLRSTLRDKVKNLSEVSGGYSLRTTGITEQAIKRDSTTAPYHFVVDGIIKWNK